MADLRLMALTHLLAAGAGFAIAPPRTAGDGGRAQWLLRNRHQARPQASAIGGGDKSGFEPEVLLQARR